MTNEDFYHRDGSFADRPALTTWLLKARAQAVYQQTLATRAKAAAIDVTSLERRAQRPLSFLDLFLCLFE